MINATMQKLICCSFVVSKITRALVGDFFFFFYKNFESANEA